MKLSEALAVLLWLAIIVGMFYLLGWSMNVWAALGWQDYSL